jgi:hypothetical protein
MPLQALIIPFVVIALVAIVWRFLPRAADGSIRLPAVIDESVGMWFVRSALGRAADPPGPDEPALPEPAEDEIAYRIGVPGAPPPTTPSRVVVSSAPTTAAPVLSSSSQAAIPPAGPIARDGSAGPPPTARPSGALAAQRRWAGAVALVAVAIAVTALVLRSRQLDGEVLSATGTPATSVGQGFVSGAAAAPSDTPAAATDPSPSIDPLPSELLPIEEASGPPAATVGPAATTRVPTAPAPAARVTPGPARTPTPTARPTPVATPRPGPSQSTAPSPTPAPTATPTPSTEPSGLPSP